MKKLILALALCLGVAPAFGQGTVAFSNHFPTRITNALTGQPASGTNLFRVALYWAVDGVTNEGSFVQIGANATIGSPGLSAGLFSAGTRTTRTNTPPGGHAMFQVRAWEVAYGTNYEAAVVAPTMNGRRALLGRSNLMRIKTGGTGIGAPSQLFGSNANPGLQPFVLDIAGDPQPQFSVTDVLVFEGDTGTTSAVFHVTLEYPTTNEVAVSVDFDVTDLTASYDSDFVGTNGTLVFAPGETNKTIEVTVFGDTESENDEQFYVYLSNPTNGIVARALARGTIYNDDCRTSLGAALYTGVTLEGCAGKPYRIEASDAASGGSWQTLTNFVLPSSPYTWIDFTASSTSQRIYRAILLAP